VHLWNLGSFIAEIGSLVFLNLSVCIIRLLLPKRRKVTGFAVFLIFVLNSELCLEVVNWFNRTRVVSGSLCGTRCCRRILNVWRGSSWPYQRDWVKCYCSTLHMNYWRLACIMSPKTVLCAKLSLTIAMSTLVNDNLCVIKQPWCALLCLAWEQHLLLLSSCPVYLRTFIHHSWMGRSEHKVPGLGI